MPIPEVGGQRLNWRIAHFFENFASFGEIGLRWILDCERFLSRLPRTEDLRPQQADQEAIGAEPLSDRQRMPGPADRAVDECLVAGGDAPQLRGAWTGSWPVSGRDMS